MNCLIDRTIKEHYMKGKNAEIIKRYIRMKYRVNIDLKALKTRLQNYKPEKTLELA